MTDDANDATDVIHDVIDRWHQHLRGQLPGGLDELLHDDVVFYSPVVFTPQVGKDLTKLYLSAAAQTFTGGSGSGSASASASSGGSGSSDGGFRYVKQVLSGDTAILEFETTMAGKYVNGVDIIRADETGQIVEFRVMIRPLQAVNAVHEQMRSALGLG